MTAWVHDWVAYHASRRPDAPALTDIARGETRSWGDLEIRVGRLAFLLRHDFGLEPGDRVAMIAENDIRILELQFACMRAGLILVPMSWRLAIGEMIVLAKDAGPKLIFHDEQWRETADAVADATGIGPRISWSDTIADSDMIR
jgi:fatty-acyl-CoA synthase